ncbi:MAG: arginine repressor [Acidimicrobiia bacterium]|jgi:transcriptional regulator of arginine metabolism
MTTTGARRRALRTLLAEQEIRNQAEVVGLLASLGHVVTQSTVSRDLQAIGAVKNGAGGYVLGSVEDPDGAGPALGRALEEFAASIEVSGNLVVVRTPPGAAHVVAATLDAAALEGVLGTVAGDDTLLVVASEEIGGAAVARRLERIGAER